jgi:hypothetical protein
MQLTRPGASAAAASGPGGHGGSRDSMPITFTNRSMSSPLLVPLSSGRTLRLPPGGTSQELPDREAEGNPKVEKLRRQGLLDVREETAATDTPARSRKKNAPEESGQE